MYQDAYNTVMGLLNKPFIKKISFTKLGFIEVKFTFIQNKVTYKSFDDLLETVEKIEELK